MGIAAADWAGNEKSAVLSLFRRFRKYMTERMSAHGVACMLSRK